MNRISGNFTRIQYKPHRPQENTAEPLIFQALEGAKKMWDYERNDCLPEDVQPTSKKEIHWICKEGHRFTRTPLSCRNQKAVTCPECRRLQTTVSGKPHMMKFWDFEKNSGDVTQLSAKSPDKAHWKCPNCGYAWEATIRTRKNDLCPCCDVGSVICAGINDFATVYPELGLDFDQTLNPGIEATALGVGSHERILWCCHICGYRWKAPIYGRIRKEKGKPYYVAKCPVCAKNKRVDSFEKDFPQLAEIYSKNNDIPLSEARYGNQYYLWKCKEHGEFSARLSQIIRAITQEKGNIGCPYCHGTKVLREDSFGVRFPDLLREWSDENILSPFEITPGSSFNATWECRNGHIWKANIRTRTLGYGYCRECHPLTKSQRTFIEVYPELETAFSLKNEAPLHGRLLYDTSQVLWVCPEKGHEFEDSCYNINQRGNLSCPICNFRTIISGINDLKTLYPSIAALYDSERNELPADRISPKSSDPNVFWKCELGHSYSRSPAIQIKVNAVCLVCSERALGIGYNDLKTKYPQLEALWDADENGPMEKYHVDTEARRYAFLCEKGHNFTATVQRMIKHQFQCLVCIGVQFHKDISLAVTDPALASEWSPNNSRTADSVTSQYQMQSLWRCPICGGEYLYSIAKRFVGDHVCPFCNGQRLRAGLNDLTTTHPVLAKEWSPNNKRTPQEFWKSSRQYVLWICPRCNSEYSAEIRSREVGDDACPYCSGLRIKRGVNDITTTNPELLPEWSPNNQRAPWEYRKTSGDYALWICPKCHGEYSHRIQSRELGDNSCPFCRGFRVLKGYNDLATTHPELAKEWSPQNKNPIEACLKTSHDYALWICPKCKGEYSFRINNREEGDDACPFCRNSRVLPGFNDLEALAPQLATEWSPSNPEPPRSYLRTSSWRALWSCPCCGGEYSAAIRDREAGDDACPFCRNSRVLSGLNDLETLEPQLVVEWSPSNPEPPRNYLRTSSWKALWKCPRCGGEYSAAIRDREAGDDACPFCNNTRALPGFNTLAVKYPQLLGEWSAAENTLLGVNPGNVLDSDPCIVWWKCPECKQKYTMRIKDRVLKERRGITACTYCNGRRIHQIHFLA